MIQMLSFVSKVSKTKTRSRENKDYYTFRVNIPKEISDKLELTKEDYLLLRAEKAEWYHLLDWKEMQKTWSKMPQELREKIKNSGLETPNGPETLTQQNVMSDWKEMQKRSDPFLTQHYIVLDKEYLSFLGVRLSDSFTMAPSSLTNPQRQV